MSTGVLPDESNGFVKSADEPTRQTIDLSTTGYCAWGCFRGFVCGRQTWDVACGLQHGRTGPPPAPRAFAQGVTNGPGLNSSRGSWGNAGTPPRRISG